MTVHFVHLLDDLKRRSLRMAALVEDVVSEACDAVLDGDASLARRVIGRDETVDGEEVAVESEVIRLLALYQPVGGDLRLLCTALKVNNDLERIADCAVNLAERALHLVDEPEQRGRVELREMCLLVRQRLRRAVQAYGTEDASIAQEVRLDDDQVDDLYSHIIRDLAGRERDPSESLAPELDVLSVAKNLERIADHPTKTAEGVIFLVSGESVRHPQ